MPAGPKGQKRPADVIGNAVKVMRIATGEEEEVDDLTDKKKTSATKAIKAKAAKARSAALTPEQRSEIARFAADARWKKT